MGVVVFSTAVSAVAVFSTVASIASFVASMASAVFSSVAWWAANALVAQKTDAAAKLARIFQVGANFMCKTPLSLSTRVYYRNRLAAIKFV